MCSAAKRRFFKTPRRLIKGDSDTAGSKEADEYFFAHPLPSFPFFFFAKKELKITGALILLPKHRTQSPKKTEEEVPILLFPAFVPLSSAFFVFILFSCMCGK